MHIGNPTPITGRQSTLLIKKAAGKDRNNGERTGNVIQNQKRHGTIDLNMLISIFTFNENVLNTSERRLII